MANKLKSSGKAFAVALLSDGVAPWVIGGIQRHSRMLAIHLARAGATVDLFHTVASDAARHDAESLAGFPSDVRDLVRSHVVDLPKPGRLPGHYLYDSERLSERLLERYRRTGISADFIYAQGLTGMAFTRARRECPGSVPPVGVNQHGYEMFQAAADWRTYLQHLMLRRSFVRVAREADLLFSFPGRILRIVEKRIKIDPRRIAVVPNAVDESWIRTSPRRADAKRRFIFIGRHERRKGMPELVDALARMGGLDFEFHFVGPIPEQLRIARPNLIYHGAIRDPAVVRDLLDNCDALVCPSFAEGMPTVVLEAMSRGLAVIATDVGATCEWVSEETGILLEQPSADGIAAAITTLCLMPADQLLALQAAALARARQYTWPRVAEMTLKSMQEIIEEPQAGSHQVRSHRHGLGQLN